MRTIAVVACAALVLTACAAQRETSTVSVSQSQTVRYTVPADVAGGLTGAAIVARYVEAAQSATGYHLERRDANDDTLGVRVVALSDRVDVGYVHQHGPKLYHNLIGTFGVAVSRQGSDIAVDVTCPTSARVESSSLGGLYGPFIEQAKAVADLRSICSRASLLFERRETGEIDVPYNDVSVYANFKRKLAGAQAIRSATGQIDPSKFVWYYLKDGAKTMVVGVQVFPYRNGSKVTYVWPNNVVCRPNGTCNFDPTAAKRVNEVIAAIAND